MKISPSISIKNLCSALFLLTFIFSLIPSVAGADFWEKKEYKEWSEKDCRKMLEDSPWAEKYEKTHSDLNRADPTASDGAPLFIRYRIQLRSALPIRQAIVRQTQIANNYDDLPAEQQQAIDKQTDALLNVNYDDYVVVYISFEANHRNVSTDLLRHWQTQNTEMLKYKVYLSDSEGNKIPLAQYTYDEGDDSFQFVFNRKVNGEELLGPEDKDLNLEFGYPDAGIAQYGQKMFTGGTAYVEFKTKNMTFNDKLEY